MNYYAITSEFYISINQYTLGSEKLFSALKNNNLSLIELINYSYLNLFLNITIIESINFLSQITIVNSFG